MNATVRRRLGSGIERQIARTVLAMESASDAASKLALRENLIRLQSARAKARRDDDAAVREEHQVAIESEMPYGVYARSYEEIEELIELDERHKLANDEMESPYNLGDWIDTQED